jgi:hypothetical protein
MAARRRSHCHWDDLAVWEPGYNSGAENEMGEKVPKSVKGPTFFEKVPLGVSPSLYHTSPMAGVWVR